MVRLFEVSDQLSFTFFTSFFAAAACTEAAADNLEEMKPALLR